MTISVVDKKKRPALARRRQGHPVIRPVGFVGVKYLRASQDAEGFAVSVDTQLDEGDEFFDDNGIVDGGTFCDNDISASLYATEERPQYELALQEIREGRANLLWVFDQSRAQRDLEIYAEVRRLLIDVGGYLAYGGRIYDMSDPADRKATSRDAVDAENLSDTISINSRRGVKKRAKSGKHAGPVPYGYRRRYDPDTGKSLGQEIVHDEMVIIEWIAQRCLDNRPLSETARLLNALGVPTPRAGVWDYRKVRDLVTEHQHPREWARLLARLTPEGRATAQEAVNRVAEGESCKGVAKAFNRDGIPYVFRSLWCPVKVKNVALSKPAAGIRVYHGQQAMTKKPTGDGGTMMVPVKAQWDNIVDPKDHMVLTARLNAPDRAAKRDAEKLVHYWSGIARCGECESVLTVRTIQGEPRYTCYAKSCVSRNYERLHYWLTEQALSLLERPDAAEVFRVRESNTDSAAAMVEAERLRAELEGWRNDAAAGRVSRESFISIESGLLERIGKAEEKARRVSLPPALSGVVGVNARAAFAALDIVGKRDILRAIMRPRIFKTKKKKRGVLDTTTIDPGFLYAEPAGEVAEVTPAAEAAVSLAA